MAAATVAGALFTNPKYPRAFPAGLTKDYVAETIPTTSLDDAGDIFKMLPMRGSRRILGLTITNADMDTNATETLDADIVLVDDNGTTILFNAGTAFEDANLTSSAIRVPLAVEVVSLKNDAYIGWKVNTAAATAAAGLLSLWVDHEGTGG